MRQCNMVAASADGGELLKPFVDRKEELTQSWHHAHQFEFVHLKCYEPTETQPGPAIAWRAIVVHASDTESSAISGGP
jgi:hypothetical protein